MAYFMMLTVFREKELLYEMIAVVAVLCVYLAARQFFAIRLLSGNARFQSFTTILLICLFTFSAILPLYLPKVHQSLEERVNRSENILMMKGFMIHSMSTN
ncbi:hypothetical protein [Enterococcus faecium]|uniref:hypothetical protein n=1 Tax=Enterococcus faecium TaxID=1352 RepID=UPI003CC72872